MSPPVLVSACLLGLHTRYDGDARTDERVLAYLRERQLTPVPVCPEQLAGLPTPRPRSHFAAGDGELLLKEQGKLRSESGEDMGAVFLRGAAETLEIARLTGSRMALLKERSPSCGRHFIYRGEKLVSGQGVACALLRRNGIEVRSEEDLPPLG